MTLCIAAVCESYQNSRIVLCSDRRIETQEAGGEIEDKLRFVSPRWVALVAGDISRAEELVSTYGEYLRGRKLSEHNVLDEMKRPAQIQKLAEENIQTALGIPYKEFLSKGLERLPQDMFRGMLFDVQRMNLGCELIVAGFVGGEPYIFVVDRYARVSLSGHFAVIGSGAGIASPALFQRKHHQETVLSRALYNVYEAKVLGEIAPGVGKKTYIDVIRPGKRELRIRTVTDDGLRFLKQQYEKFGPKQAPAAFSLRKGYLREF